MYDIAIIDDMINREKLGEMGSNKVDIHSMTESFSPKIVTHSTRVAEILLKNMDNINLLNVNIFKKNSGIVAIDFLIKALEFCLNKELKMIVMSVGTTDYEGFIKIQPVIDKLVRNGVIIIAATSNDKKVTFPAAFENVISVRSNTSIESGFFSMKEANFLGTDIETNALGDFDNSNSYAAPYIASLIWPLINKKRMSTKKDLLDNLRNHPLFYKMSRTQKTSSIAHQSSSSIGNHVNDDKKKHDPIGVMINCGKRESDEICQIIGLFEYSGYRVALVKSFENDIMYFTLNQWMTSTEPKEIKHEIFLSLHNPDLLIFINEGGKLDNSSHFITIDKVYYEKSDKNFISNEVFDPQKLYNEIINNFT